MADAPTILLDFIGTLEIISPIIVRSLRIIENHDRVEGGLAGVWIEGSIGHDFGPDFVLVQRLLKKNRRRQAGVEFALHPFCRIGGGADSIDCRAGG